MSRVCWVHILLEYFIVNSIWKSDTIIILRTFFPVWISICVWIITFYSEKCSQLLLGEWSSVYHATSTRLGQSRRRWTNLEPALRKLLVFVDGKKRFSLHGLYKNISAVNLVCNTKTISSNCLLKSEKLPLFVCASISWYRTVGNQSLMEIRPYSGKLRQKG